jgi:FLVCR family MFS transporter
VGGILLGRFADKFRNHKRLLVGLLGGSAISFTLFSLVCSNIFHVSPEVTLALLFVFSAAGGFCLNSTIPLFYELSIEVTYPHPEATVVTMLTNVNNLGCLLFLGIPSASAGTGWMNYTLVGCLIVFTLLMGYSFETKALRYDFDRTAGAKQLNDENTTNLVDHDSMDHAAHPVASASVPIVYMPNIN